MHDSIINRCIKSHELSIGRIEVKRALKLIILISLVCFLFFSCLEGIEADTKNAIPSSIPLNSDTMFLPAQYNSSYVLGLYEGSQTNTHRAFQKGLVMGLSLNFGGIIVAPLIAGISQPERYPEGFVKNDFKKGYEDRSASLNRYAAYKGATTGAIIQTVLFTIFVISNTHD